VQALEIDGRLILCAQQEDPALLVLEEQVLRLAARDLAAQCLRLGDGEHRRMLDGRGLDPELIEIGHQLFTRRGHAASSPAGFGTL
jgi:hypothetical protein